MRWLGVFCVVLLVAACGGGDATDISMAATEPEETAVDCRGEPGPHQLAYEIPGPNDVAVRCDLVYKAAPSGPIRPSMSSFRRGRGLMRRSRP